MTQVRAYRIPVEARRGGHPESQHLVLAASAGVPTSSRYETDPETLPWVWIRSTAKPFQLLPLLLSDAGSSLLEDARDVAVCVSSHDGTPEHAARVEAILHRHGLGREWLQCGVHRPYFLQRIAAGAGEHGGHYDALNNNCSGNHAAMLLWARVCGTPLASYLDTDSDAQRILHAALGAASGSEPVIAVDNCGAPCYQMPLVALARAYRALADPVSSREWIVPSGAAAVALEPVETRLQRLEQIGQAMASSPRWVSGDGTEATRLAAGFPGDLIVKHGAEGVLCVASRQHRASLALKVLDGNARALFPALIPLLQEFGWCDPQRHHDLAELAQPVLKGPPGHTVGQLCAGTPTTQPAATGDAPTPAV